MPRQTKSTSNLARRIAFVLVFLGTPAAALGVGCGGHETLPGPPSGGPPNGTTHPAGSGGGSGTGGSSGGTSICGCAVMLVDPGCRTCTQDKIDPGAPCQGVEDQCKNDTACVDDSQCIGACLHPDSGTSPDPACIYACLQVATQKYGAYLSCICKQCSQECASPVTCPTGDGGTGGGDGG